MSIKSDVWIKQMCREEKLIDPFEEKLVRTVDDRRIISCANNVRTVSSLPTIRSKKVGSL